MGTRYMTAAVAVAFGSLFGAPAPAVAQDIGSASRSCSTVMGSEVCAWVRMSGDTVLELGASVPLALVEGVPADAPMLWPPDQLAVVRLPPEARAALGLDHVGINWEAHGHAPAPFMTPHFDFHFYNLSQARVQGIDCSDPSKPERVPEGYELPDVDVPELGLLVGLCAPAMGMHALPVEDIAGTEPFTGSMVIGYYRATPIFFEPMVSQALLMREADFTLPMPAVEDLPEGVRYPREFTAEYDGDGRQYRFIFRGFGEG